MAEKPLNRYGEMMLLLKGDNEYSEKAIARDRAIFIRRYIRVHTWAMRQSQESNADYLATLFLMHAEQRRKLRRKNLSLEVARGRASGIKEFLQPLADKWRKLLADRRKTRRSRMPRLDAWMESQDLTLSNGTLFDLLLSLGSDSEVYRDGDVVVEVNGLGDGHEITRDGFDKRLTEARKRR